MVDQSKNKNYSHMKTFIRTLACLGVLGLLASCQMYEIDTQMTPEKAAASIRMVCDALPSYTVAATNPGTVTFNVSSNTPWTITRSSDADWCTVTPSSSSAGALISDVVVSFDNNESAEDRTATLTLKGDKVGLPVTIQITQNRLGSLFVTPVSQDYVAAGGPLTFTIKTNVPWEVSSDEGWLSFNRESGEPDPEGRTITIIATAEPSTVLERYATVTVKAGDEEESFDVVQKAKFRITDLFGEFPGMGGTLPFRITTDLPWEVSSDKGWISFDKESGIGDGSSVEVNVTAAVNEGLLRTAVINVRAGGAVNSFTVIQKGATFEIVSPASTEIDRQGGQITLAVNATIAWEPSTDVEGWTVKKVDDTHFTVSAGWNDKFAAKAGNVTIKGPAGEENSISLTQGVNFELNGSYEVQADGSVKLLGDNTSNITLVDGFRYGSVELLLGDVSFADDGNFWFENHTDNTADGGNTKAQLYNWCAVGKTRLRAEGTANGKSMNEAGTSYMSTTYELSKDEFNAMTAYKMTLSPNAGDPTLLDMEFFYNGASRCQATCQNPFTSAGLTGKTFVGFHSASAASWVVVKSCNVAFAEE